MRVYTGSLAIMVAAMFFLGCIIAISTATEDDAVKIGRVSENEEAGKLGNVIGIHLGATHSCVGVYKNDKVNIIPIIPNQQGKRITPSWVAFGDNETLIGEAAKDQAAINQERTIFHVKRLIGRKFEDEEVQRAIKLVPYKIVNIDGRPYIKVKMKDGEAKVFSPEEISAMILVKMKEIAEAFLGMKVKNAVLTVPVYFNDAQRQATKDAGVIAGLNVVKIINEPVAAAIGYGLHKKYEDDDEKNILVFHLGGATFDVTILGIDEGDYKVLAATGDKYLGGDVFDHRIMKYYINLIKENHGEDISKDNKALDKLRREIERAKREVNKFIVLQQHPVPVEIESLFGGTNFSQLLTRPQFEELNNDLFRKTMGLVKKAMDDAGLQERQINEIVFVGGSTRMPKFQKLLKDYFKEVAPNIGIHPEVAVAYGAAILGGILSGEDVYKKTNEILSLPVFPVSLGIETEGGKMTKLIPKNTIEGNIKKSHVITTLKDQQTTVPIKVYQGQGKFTKNCRLLGKFNLSGIPPAPRGTPRIEVTFKINLDEAGLAVKAEDKGTGKANNITINHWWFGDYIKQRFEDQAAETDDEGMKWKEVLDAYNRLDTYISNMTNQINDKDKLADKLETHEKEKIEDAIIEGNAWLIQSPQEKERYQEKLKAVEAVCEPIVTAVYRKRPDHITPNTWFMVYAS